MPRDYTRKTPKTSWARLTEAHRALVDDYRAKYETPLKIYIHKFPRDYRFAVLAGLSHEDMEQHGWVGVCRAAAKFDPERGIQFTTYAKFWIRHAITAAAETSDRMSPRSQGKRVVSGDAAVGRYAIRKRFDLMPDLRDNGPVVDDGLRDKIEVALKQLPARFAQVIRLRWGIGDGRKRTMQEVGQIIGVGRERVRQIEQKAFERIRVPLQLACFECED